MVRLSLVALLFVAALSGPMPVLGDATVTGAPDYADAANWVCRPGAESICTTGLDATVESPRGVRKAAPFIAAAAPSIDCFYVYPTVSREPSDYADLQDSPEIQETVNAQAGRLTSRCRLFAPIYRQATLAHLRARMKGMNPQDFGYAKDDVEAAWRYYLANDNHGRGVVVIGHSQGTILLQDLLANEIDGKPAERLLVAAYLAGDPSLAVPRGKNVGGTFEHIPTCSSAAEVRCAYAWGSYLDGDAAEARKFGRPRRDGMTSSCDNPAAPGGGSGSLKFFHPKAADAAAGDPPWVETVDALRGACRADENGNGFFVTSNADALSRSYAAMLADSDIGHGWGIHPRDLSLVQGNILDVLDEEIATWTRTHSLARR